MKGTVRLRERAMKSGKKSLYLDVYAGGRRTYEYLGLYLIPESTAADKKANRETMALARAVEAKRIVELKNNRFGFATETFGDVYVMKFADEFVADRLRNASAGYAHIVRCTMNRARAFFGERLKFNQLTAADLVAWKENMCMDMKPSAVSTYMSVFKTFLREAKDNGLIAELPTDKRLKRVRVDSVRQYLTIEELRRLIGTPEPSGKGIREAFIFSCLTGLRHSDVFALRWGDVSVAGGYVRLTFRQKKTRGMEYLDATAQVLDYMGERKGDAETVFVQRWSNPYSMKLLRKWAADAGINKPITFHSARHTFATMMLELGADLYTVSKLLGHRSIATTQLYAKVVDKTKRSAVDNIPK